MSFGLYLIGFVILIGGLVYGAAILHLAAHWIVVGAIPMRPAIDMHALNANMAPIANSAHRRRAVTRIICSPMHR